MDFMASQLFAYEKKGDSAVILRCFSHDGNVRIPEKIDGLPVRELAPYAFSSHMDERELTDAFHRGDLRIASPEPVTMQRSGDNWKLDNLPAVSGERLESVILPQTMGRVGRYCFYDCARLKRLEFPGALYDWGSGAFSGCHRIETLCVYVKPDGASGLKQVLDELPESLDVEFCTEDADGLGQKRMYARLAFPEFYEEGVENTPARILETHVHGTGILYRNCFQGKKFDFAQYDVLFPHAQAQEEMSLLIRLVLGRLRVPYHMEQRARKAYETFIRENAFPFGRYFLDSKDEEGLRWFLEQMVSVMPDDEKAALADRLSEYAARRKDAQAIGRLMDFRREMLPDSRRRKRLDL
ncbi:MAG: leucine-rich repeat domain-containing protein [Lachnospiraceae bacterium]|nr:leucine-rich repeat domain-containing protein [Lachnospiraceae bacterium]